MNLKQRSRVSTALCTLKHGFIGEKQYATIAPSMTIAIENSVAKYSICKTELYSLAKEKYEKDVEKQRHRSKE